jgi:hypothetical protein
MARWRLREPHYLKTVPPTEWEQVETNLITGKQARKRYEVPVYLDPNQPADWTHRELATVIVCWPGKGQPRDIVFEGDPTPNMIPEDEEAEEISASFEEKWKHPIEGLEAQGGFGEALLRDLTAQIAAAVRSGGAPVKRDDEIEELKKMVAQLMEANAKLEQRAEGKGRRV